MLTGRPYDLIIFGASGFTGQYVVEETARVASDADGLRPLTWTVAGRSRTKLEEALGRAASALGIPELKSKECIICDVNDPLSLAAMCQQGSVILNCVGPFLEGMQLKYDHQAADKEVYIVGSCGFDSIPADMGVLFTRNQLKGILTAVESFVLIKTGPEGATFHEGTWQSAVHGISDQDNLRRLRRQFGQKPLPVVGTKLTRRGSVFYSDTMNQYAIPFMGSDASVVKRTQRYLHENLNESPVQYGAYVAVGGIGSVIFLMVAGFFFWCFTKCRLGRKLLIKYPEFFSFGYFTRQGPTQKQMEGTSFSMTFFGEGYPEGLNPQHGKPSVKICTQVKGPEPGYIATPIAMVQAAVTILWEQKSLPTRGGVYSPGAAFLKTTLIERLNTHGIEFTVISKPEA
ncbi:saccharopine dehydrogenase a, tandem duplicate 1 isoform X2 [Stegostoma tigrinum]|uniref:saccharopine dehydrogenase a, tandem duplicate 1 isoform X2 n=1 Tax=Stegostoma tigrinum TaxID=3053191 RepID=UPI00202B5446|nr:saccharopine dehydrogenase a, tandem duplicate 1 isoform X2 [Stegostoma tigrinum]